MKNTDKGLEQLIGYIETNKPDIAVFDFDGTLTYTEDLHWHYYHEMLKSVFDIDYPYPLHKNTTGMRYDQATEWLSEYFGFDKEAPLMASYKNIHPHRITDELIEIDRDPYAYVKPLVDLFHKTGTTLAIVSANDVYTISERLNRWGLDEKFSMIYSVVAKSDSKAHALDKITAGMDSIVFDDADHVLDEYRKFDHVKRVAVSHPFSKSHFENRPELYDFIIDVESECDIIDEAKRY